MSERDVLAEALLKHREDIYWAVEHAASKREIPKIADAILAALNAAGYTVARKEDDDLGAAWAAAEAALPGRAAGLSVGHAAWRGTGEDREFYAHIITPGVGGGPETGAYGPTPAAALRALAAKARRAAR